ncbi:VanZ family protein [Bifidobacterium cuniculi]|nr:VanZ family protein [Bifidobacterium cuniculi]
MLSYIGLFSHSFLFALTLWPFVAAVLTLPILAVMYHRDHRLYLSSGLIAYVAVLYAVGLLTFTLYPMPDDPAMFCATHRLLPQLNIMQIVPDAMSGLDGVLQLVMNVVFFLPMGFMLRRWARWPFWIAAVFGFGCSVFIETSQLTGFWGLYPCAYRQFDVDDMLTNTTGAVLGYLVAMLVGRIWPTKDHEETGINDHPGFVHRMVALIIDVVIMQICVWALTMPIMFAFTQVATRLEDGRYTLGELVVDTDMTRWVPRVLAILAFLVFEVWIPWKHQGRTLGGSYTQMTCETVPRRGARRVGFYAVRTVVLGAWYVLLVDGMGRWFWLLMLGLLVWWLFAKRMPWDLVPAGPAGKDD